MNGIGNDRWEKRRDDALDPEREQTSKNYISIICRMIRERSEVC
jgi:hypothetical protein